MKSNTNLYVYGEHTTTTRMDIICLGTGSCIWDEGVVSLISGSDGIVVCLDMWVEMSFSRRLHSEKLKIYEKLYLSIANPQTFNTKYEQF